MKKIKHFYYDIKFIIRNIKKYWYILIIPNSKNWYDYSNIYKILLIELKDYQSKSLNYEKIEDLDVIIRMLEVCIDKSFFQDIDWLKNDDNSYFKTKWEEKSSISDWKTEINKTNQLYKENQYYLKLASLENFLLIKTSEEVFNWLKENHLKLWI